MSRWITVEEAAEYLTCSKHAIYKAIWRGDLKASKTKGIGWRTKFEWCDQYMERNAA